MKIGVQLYTLRNYAKNEAQLNDVFKKVREMGYTLFNTPVVLLFRIKSKRKI